MNGYAGEQEVAFGRMLLERLGGCAFGTQGLGQSISDIGQRMSGAAGNDECTLREQRQGLVPSLNLEKASMPIKKNTRSELFEAGSQFAHGVDGIVGAGCLLA